MRTFLLQILSIATVFILMSSCCSTPCCDEDCGGTANGKIGSTTKLSVPHSFSGESFFSLPPEYEKPQLVQDSVTKEYTHVKLVVLKNENRNKLELPWVVYSDRVDNKTYHCPNNRKVYSSVGYLDRFYVVDTCKGWVHIVADPEMHFVGEKLSSKAKDMGWINKTNLILWRKPLANSTTASRIKALTINTIDALKDANKKTDFNTVEAFCSPQLIVPTDSVTPMYRFFYLYKQTENAYLLGRKRKIDPHDDPREVFFGWVDKKRFIIWDNRLVLEPNWKNAKERQRKGIDNLFFKNIENAISYKETGVVDDQRNIIFQSEATSSRMRGNQFRFPVFSKTSESGILHVGAIGPVTLAGMDVSTEFLDMNYLVNQIAGDLRTINVLFLVDCTNSMSGHLPMVASAITNQMKNLKGKHKNTINFGACGYRGKIKGSTRYAFVRPSFGFTKDYRKVAKFLRHIKPKNTQSHSEMMYHGMREALNYMGMEERANNTNIIIMIGDAGNIPEESNSDIIQILSENRCHLLAFQIENRQKKENGDYPYDNYVFQLKDIILKASEKRAAAISSSDKKFSPAFEPPINGLHRLNEDSPLTGAIYACPRDSSKSSNEMRLAIEGFIHDATKAVDKMIFLMKEGHVNVMPEVQANDDNVFKNSYRTGIVDILRDNKVSKETFTKMFLNRKTQLVYPSYTNMISPKVSSPLYEYCILIEKRDLTKITGNLYFLTKSGTREDFVFKFMELLSIIKGEIISSYSPNDAMKVIFGLPSQHPVLRKKNVKKIEHLLGSMYVTDAEFKSLKRHILESLHKLADISDGEISVPSFKDDTKVYYWIPRSFLP